METVYEQRIDQGNNESLLRGIYQERDGGFLAMTYTKSRSFKTFRGAARWFEKRTGITVTENAN